MESVIEKLSGLIWGEYVLIPLLAFTGVFLTLGLRAFPWRKLGLAMRVLWSGRVSGAEVQGDIPPFQALMTAMSATIGTGNIAGVATAIFAGGPGAVFWMWVIAVFGMSTKFAEAVLAVTYREEDELGNYVGGPMYYIKNGLGPHWQWLGMLFALFGMLAAFGIGNLVQSNTVANVMLSTFEIPLALTGTCIALLAGVVILGGIKRIGEVAAKLVPFMAISYVLCGVIIILSQITQIPAVIRLILESAFSGTAATGGFAGATVWAAIRFGVARGIFSNEAGLGSAPIAHAAAQTHDPVRQGMIAMLGTFIDTLIICTMTAFVILLSNTWTSGSNGAELSSLAFDSALPGLGGPIVAVALAIFAFTTILGWSYYGERCAEFVFGIRIIMPYRLCWITVILMGAMIQKITIVWNLSDLLNGLMALPNLIALLLLSPVVFASTRAFRSQS